MQIIKTEMLIDYKHKYADLVFTIFIQKYDLT